MGCCDQPGLTPIPQALATMLAEVSATISNQQVKISEAKNRILAEDIRSQVDIPPFDNSAMDGYAFAHNQVTVNQDYSVSQKIFAGDKPAALQTGTLARIMTGAPLPEGADSVEMQENVTASGDIARLNQAVKLGQNVRKRGEDIAKGQVVLSKGTRLNAAHIGLLASIGVAEVSVSQKIKVGMLSSGDELIQPGQPLEPGQIYDSNRFAVSALLQGLPLELVDYGVIPDQLEAYKAAFLKADKECDFVICSGGVSVGEADFTKIVLDELGQIKFWKLAIKPGKPFAFGLLPNSYFIGLPGNPVSAFVTAYKLALPLLAKAINWDLPAAPVVPAIAEHGFKKRPGRTDYQRGVLSLNQDGQACVASTGKQGSGIFTSLANSNCFIVLEQERGSVEAGEQVSVELYDYPFM